MIYFNDHYDFHGLSWQVCCKISPPAMIDPFAWSSTYFGTSMFFFEILKSWNPRKAAWRPLLCCSSQMPILWDPWRPYPPGTLVQWCLDIKSLQFVDTSSNHLHISSLFKPYDFLFLILWLSQSIKFSLRIFAHMSCFGFTTQQNPTLIPLKAHHEQ